MKGSGITKGEDEEEDAESLLESGRIQRKDKGVVGEGTFGRPPRPFNLALHHQQIPDKNAVAANHGRIAPDDEKKVPSFNCINHFESFTKFFQF